MRRGLAGLLVLAIAIGGFEGLYRDRIYPRVAACGIDLGGRTEKDATTSLWPCSVKQRFRTVVLQARGHAPTLVLASDLGYQFDGSWTAWRAFQTGHSGPAWQRATAQARALVIGVDVPLGQRVDEGRLRRYLFMFAAGVDRQARPRSPGQNLDVATAQRRITRLLLDTVGGFRVDLPLNTTYAAPPERHWPTIHVRSRGRLDRKHRG